RQHVGVGRVQLVGARGHGDGGHFRGGFGGGRGGAVGRGRGRLRAGGQHGGQGEWEQQLGGGIHDSVLGIGRDRIGNTGKAEKRAAGGAAAASFDAGRLIE